MNQEMAKRGAPSEASRQIFLLPARSFVMPRHSFRAGSFSRHIHIFLRHVTHISRHSFLPAVSFLPAILSSYHPAGTRHIFPSCQFFHFHVSLDLEVRHRRHRARDPPSTHQLKLETKP
jgi:hypothetical protein